MILRAALSGLLLCLASASWGAEDDDLTEGLTDIEGVVLDEVGEPVVGAQIFVESARPRRGSSVLCPTCYPDCSKRARTDAKGEFKLPSMDRSLLFRLVLVAKGYEGTAMDKVDPLLSPISCALWKRPPPTENQALINARIYDSAGKPAAGALVDIEGAETAKMTTWGGHKQFIQEIGISDETGLMTLVGSAELKAGIGVLQARGFARQWVRLVPGKDHLFILRPGVLVSGRAAKNGKPVAGLQVGFAGADRSAGEFLRGWNVLTDADGRFAFEHITAAKAFVVFGTAKSAAKLGLLPIRPITTGLDGTKLDLGTIELQTPFRLRGRVVLEDGESAFPGSRIALSRENAWDNLEANLDDEGHFEFAGLGPEVVEIYSRISGYKFSKKNPNRLSSRSLAGRITENLDDFLIVLEPADDGDGRGGDDDQNWNIRETALRSAKK